MTCLFMKPSKMSSVKEHEVIRDASKAPRCGFSLSTETFQCCFGRTPRQLRQCFGHAFISYCSFFFSISVASLKMFYALRFLVFIKDSWSISVLFSVLMPLLNSPDLYSSIFYCQVSSRKRGFRRWRRISTSTAWMPVLPAISLLWAITY